jgi:hypothetical protein
MISWACFLITFDWSLSVIEYKLPSSIKSNELCLIFFFFYHYTNMQDLNNFSRFFSKI